MGLCLGQLLKNRGVSGMWFIAIQLPTSSHSVREVVREQAPARPDVYDCRAFSHEVVGHHCRQVPRPPTLIPENLDCCCHSSVAEERPTFRGVK